MSDHSISPKLINDTKDGKTGGSDGNLSEFIEHLGTKVKSWLQELYNHIVTTLVLPTVSKPGKPLGSADSYRPVALLYTPYKIFEKLLYNRILSIIDGAIPSEQAGFRPKRSCCDQVLALTSHIESLVDLSAAYDTVWK